MTGRRRVFLKCSLSDDLTGHGRLRGIDQRVSAKNFNFHAQLVLHKLYSFSARESVAGNNCRRVYLRLDQLICSSQKFGSDNDDRGCAISDFFVLLLGKIHEDFPRWVFDCQKGQNGCTVVGDCYFLEFDRSAESKRSVLLARTPILSTSILSRPNGPKELFTMLAMDCAAITEFPSIACQYESGAIDHLSVDEPF